MKFNKEAGYSKHPHKTLTHNGKEIKIDEDIANIISSMWKLGLETLFCCQSVCKPKCTHYHTKIKTEYCDRFVYIMCGSQRVVEQFYNYIVDYDDLKISSSITLPAIDVINAVNDWLVYAQISNLSLRGINRSLNNDFRITHTVYFPREHIPYIERRLQLAIEEKSK